jgi:transposase
LTASAAVVRCHGSTAHRRFTEWTKAGLWRWLHRAVLDELGSQGLIDWSHAVLGGASVRAKKRGPMTGPNPVDRGKSVSKIHVLSDRAGIPLSVAVSAPNTHDSSARKPLVMAIPAIKSRRGPRRRKPAKLHGDKAYDQVDLRAWVREQGIAVRIARKGVESSTKLGRHRWVIERCIAWPFGYHRSASATPTTSAPSSPWTPRSPISRNSAKRPHETRS